MTDTLTRKHTHTHTRGTRTRHDDTAHSSTTTAPTFGGGGGGVSHRTLGPKQCDAAAAPSLAVTAISWMDMLARTRAAPALCVVVVVVVVVSHL